jgi:hypothetical protein
VGEDDLLDVPVELALSDDRRRAAAAVGPDVAGAAVDAFDATGLDGAARGERAAAAGAAREAGEQGGDMVGAPRRPRLVALRGFPQLDGHERLVRVRVDPLFAAAGTEADLAEVGAVADDLAGVALADAEDPGDLAPCLSGCSRLEAAHDGRRGFRVAVEAPVAAVLAPGDGVALRCGVGGPDAALHGGAFGGAELERVALELHAGGGEPDLSGPAAFGGADVEVLCDGYDLSAGALDLFDDVERVDEVEPRKPVDVGDDDPGELAALHAGDDVAEDRAVALAAGDVELGVAHLDLEAAAGGVTADPVALQLGAEEGVFAIADAGDALITGEREGHVLNTTPRLGGAKAQGGREGAPQSLIELARPALRGASLVGPAHRAPLTRGMDGRRAGITWALGPRSGRRPADGRGGAVVRFAPTPREVGAGRYIIFGEARQVATSPRGVTYKLAVTFGRIRRRDRVVGALLALYALAHAVRSGRRPTEEVVR